MNNEQELWLNLEKSVESWGGSMQKHITTVALLVPDPEKKISTYSVVVMGALYGGFKTFADAKVRFDKEIEALKRAGWKV